MKRFSGWFFKCWRQVLGYGSAFIFLSFLYTFQLNSLTRGFSRVENNYISSFQSFNSIISETIFLPHKILGFITTLLPQSVNYSRLPSAILMIAMIGCFYILMERWYTQRISILTTLLFATSSWTLTIGRQALPTVLYLSWLPILALLYWTVSKSKHHLSIYLWCMSIALALYVPGLLWFVLILALVQKNRFKQLLIMTTRLQIFFGLILFLILCIPFIYSSYLTPSILLKSLAIPSNLGQITSFPMRLLDIFRQIFIYSSGNAVFHLGHLAFLDVATSLLFFIGIYRLRFSKARKMMGWSGLIILGWLIGAGLGTVNIAIFLPVIYILVGSGLSFLLVSWFKVFPKNPIARTLASTAITILVLLITFYHLTRYYIAWPLNPATRQAFSLQISDDR